MIRSGVSDSLMDSIVDALAIPAERIVEFFMHRDPRGRTIVTVRFDASDVEAPPLKHVYEMTRVPDASDLEDIRFPTAPLAVELDTADLPATPKPPFMKRILTRG